MGTMARNLGQTIAITAMPTLLLLGAAGHASANQTGGTGPRATFIRNCEASGGSVGEVVVEGSRSASCTHVHNGTVTTLGCDFYAGYIWVCGVSSQPDSHGTPGLP